MLRHRHASATSCAFHSGQRQFTAPSLLLRQMSGREPVHGAGLVKHEPMSGFKKGSGGPAYHRFISEAPPAADLFRTAVHEGLGTGPQDPYRRTLPNQPSVLPESTVLTTPSALAPTLDERKQIDRKWGTIQYWVGGKHPRLPIYLEEMVVPRAAPVSPSAQQLLSEVEAKVLPSIAQRQKLEPADKVQAALVGRWAKAVSDYGEMSAAYLFDRAGFETKLQELHSQTESEMLRIAGGTADEIKLALEVLRRKAVLKRNAFIQENLLPLLEKADYLGEGDAVWRVFFEAVNSNRGDVFAPSVSAREGTTADGILSSEAASTSILSYTWKAIQLDDVVHTPSVTAAVALYVTLLSIEVSKLLLQDESLRSASSHLDEGIGRKQQQHHESPAQRDVRRFQLVESTIKRKFIQDTIATLLATSPGSAALARALGEVGLHDLSRETALCNAMSDTSSLEGDEVKNLVGGFESTAEVKTLLASILAGNNQEVRQHVLSTFGVISSEKQATSINVDALMARVDWTTNWRRLTADLLRHTPTIECMRALVRNAIGAKGTTKVLYSASYADKLEEVKRSRDEREARKQERLKRIVSELSSHHNVNTSIEMCRVHSGSLLPEIDFTVLQAEVTKAHSSTQSQRQSVDLRVLDGVLGLVRRRHPQWVEAGVLPREANPLSNSLEGLQMMVRMFVRLVYVPQAGAAAIAQRTRRRIGAIGKEPHEFNVPAEVGIVEQFDNLQYKRYDWQGWYQRMVDIHNRNVSIRCRLDDLKRLDGAGNPFVDVQTERRLRILSADRVGMGVLKLDSDKYEDQADNLTFGSTRLSSLLADSRKAQLGPEYWPTVEVKVRRPSGQSQAYYSTMDQDRIEKTSKTLYEKYRDAKKRSLFVTPMDLWLDVKGMQVRQKVDRADEHGYTVDSLQDTLNDGGSA